MSETPLSNDSSSNVAAPGGEVKEIVDDNMDLNVVDPTHETTDPADIINEATRSSDEKESDEVSQAAQDTLQLRISEQVRKQTGELWKARSLVLQAVPPYNVPKSYKAATTPENISFWKPGIDREHECSIKIALCHSLTMNQA